LTLVIDLVNGFISFIGCLFCVFVYFIHLFMLLINFIYLSLIFYRRDPDWIFCEPLRSACNSLSTTPIFLFFF